jgi:ABC-2 type transport system ATP-binding protein
MGVLGTYTIVTAPAAIACRGLVKRYDKLTAVDGLDLEVRAGECFGLLGPNGAGKTTTVEILEGILAPTSGEVEVLGRRWDSDDRWLRERLGISLQETHLTDKLTVRETLRVFRSFYARGRDVDALIDLVALGEKRDVWYMKLSGGQKQRLAVACALVGDPELLFLDEPTTGLDPQSRRQLWDLVVDFRAGGRTVMLTTHYMEEAQRLCDRVAIVDRGKVIALGSPRELIAGLGGTEVIEVAGRLDEKSLAALTGVHGVRALPDGFALTVEQLHVTLPALLAHAKQSNVELTRLATHHASLEDVFVSLTGRQLRD